MDTDTDNADPAAERVRRELARLGRDEASAPPVPADVTARIGRALRKAGPVHAVQRPGLRRAQILGLVLGMTATVIGVVVGATMLGRHPAPHLSSSGPTAHRITVSPTVPLSAAQIAGLLGAAPDYGALSDPGRRASCLTGLGYPPGTPLLGGRPVDMAGRPGVLLLMPGRTADAVIAVVVAPDCGTAYGGLLADTVISRP